jgi:FemAB-related protein (PEP-CTERM system-associated)
MSTGVEPFSGSGAEWDAFVRGSAGWTHCHLYGWKDVIENVLGHECLYVAARDERGQLAGVLPLVRVKSVIFGHYLISVPFLNYGGPLGSGVAVSALLQWAVQHADERRVKLLELRSRFEQDVDLPVSHHKVTVLLDLPTGDSDALWSGFKPKLRSQVRRPQKEGIEVRFGVDQVEPFYQVFARHMRDLGTPVHSRTLFQAIAATFPDDVWIGCAYDGDRPVAAGLGFRWADELEMTWASSLREYNRLAPNMLLYWSFMERAIAEGVTTFNFGRCTPGGGTHRFKLQWGGRDQQLWWYRHGREAETATVPSRESGVYALATKVWQRMPLWLANTLGPRLVRFIPA